MYETNPAFAPDQLVKGRVYKFKARNFSFGVWNGSSGFIGIREKFGGVYLFAEYHADLGGVHGTVWAIEDYPGQPQVPDGMELVEYLPVRCLKCEGPVQWTPRVPFLRKGDWHHLDDEMDHDANPYAPINKDLLAWLNQYETDEDSRAINAASMDGDDEEVKRLIGVRRERYQKESGL